MVVRLHEREPLPLTVLRAGGVLVREGAPALGVMVIESGIVRVSATRIDGRELVLDLLGRGEAVGDPPEVFSSCTIRAVTPARLRPASSTVVARLLAERARRSVDLATDLAWLGVEHRIERRFRDLADRLGRPTPAGALLPVRITQDDLAAMTGTSRETANRAVQRLIRRRVLVVVRRARYEVRTPLRLVPRGSDLATG